VILMGVAALPRICAGLLAAGMDVTTPVAVIENGWSPEQRVTRGTVQDIVERASSARSPAVIVIGAVAALGGA